MTSQDWTCRSPMLMIDSIWSFFLITAVTSLRLFPSLFPYTTLFRSACVQRLETELEDIGSQQRYGHCRPRRLESKPQVTDNREDRDGDREAPQRNNSLVDGGAGLGTCYFFQHASHPPDQDRKSTRLNSSHVPI